MNRLLFLCLHATLALAPLQVLAQDTTVKAQSQDKLVKDKPVAANPETEQVLSAMDQNAAKVQNFRVRYSIATETSPLFWGEMPRLENSFRFINGKEVNIERSIGLYSDGKVFIDRLMTRVTPRVNLQEHSKYWFNPSVVPSYWLLEKDEILKPDGSVIQVNAGVPTAYEETDPSIPFTGLGKLQIGGPKIRYTGNFRIRKARLVGPQQFNGLDCLRLEWNDNGEGRVFSNQGCSLICPTRDYKEVYSEERALSKKPDTEIEYYTRKTTVQSFEQKGDAWLPAQVRYERQDTYRSGEVRTLREVFRLIEFQGDAISSDDVFQPIFSPGTLLIKAGKGPAETQFETVGGDIKALAQALKNGDTAIFADSTDKIKDGKSQSSGESPAKK